ncbi:membrane-bound lytic murein transglycosylase MltF [Marinobacter sp. M216]|uniref:Membrane-bound lytic murein transglycosylase F n=1 Tax=Marinobacter albus TaxID=3030833 RepID=A0ABT7HEY8_9GAMM|nr:MULTISPECIES: membrane-bound lytic murein transglycosylase MltF [unclassified Marinobacter]MBW7472379.1 membrane-bound lytic murein transglycosylase MltF [Marinobacter sp. F4218]MDK9558929.1 membrane-bound lytic murein transglycosylase MltF [Marinobacter sp. M216]
MISAVVAVAGCSRPSTLQEVLAEDVLHVITREAPSIYYEGRDGPTGYDYELAKLFADELGVELRVRVAEDNTEVLSVLSRNYAHIGLAGLSGQPGMADQYKVLPTGIAAQSVVVYNRDVPRPDSLSDLEGQTLHLVAESNHEHLLEGEESGFDWQVHPGLDPAGILARVESGEFSYAAVSSNELELNHVFFPQVKDAFYVGEPEELAWLFPADQDDTLVNAANQFLTKLQSDGTLAQLAERFYGHLDQLNYVGARTFMHHVENRLPKYESLFQDYAAEFGIDWRLLAAIGYQESHWRPNAVSPTGVRGLMMLTRNTASYIGINNRLDPEESIQGGAKYFRMVHKKIPDRIPEPDRTWFALASYNVGFGHLEDARRLAESAGKSPDRWMDVKEFLPLLAQKEWYTKTRFGYARGHEPVLYVQNIRRYYDVLARITERNQTDAIKPGELVNLDSMPRGSGSAPKAEAHPELRAGLPRELGMIPPTL